VTDVLLTHSYHLAYDRKQVRKMQPYPPLGTLYAAAVLRAEGIPVAVFDPMLDDPVMGFTEALRRHEPKFVAIYEDDFNFLSKMCLTRMRELAWNMAQNARRFGAMVIAHGSDATDHAAEYLRNGVDVVLTGEAETRLSRLITTLLGGGDLGAVEGIVDLQNLNDSSKPKKDSPSLSWSSLPKPARDLIDLEGYRRAWIGAHGYFSLNMVASRGCPYRCNWCAKPISGDRFHVRPAVDVANEICELRETYQADHIWFGDDVFALNHHWAQQFASEMEKRRCTVPFKIQSRADLMTPETVSALRRSGCQEVWMGVESGSQKVLDAMDKGLLVREVMTARKNLRQAGIRACYFLQFGYPGEGWKEIEQTVALVRETRPDDIGVSLSYPLPNTPFYERVRAELGYKRNWTDSDDLCVMFQAAYSDRFYRALRDALHLEVDYYADLPHRRAMAKRVRQAWDKVSRLEPSCWNGHATRLSAQAATAGDAAGTAFVPLSRLSLSTGEA
jgi:radical SAM superfamily enzyme YgiQ (UPF0313 family)